MQVFAIALYANGDLLRKVGPVIIPRSPPTVASNLAFSAVMSKFHPGEGEFIGGRSYRLKTTQTDAV